MAARLEPDEAGRQQLQITLRNTGSAALVGLDVAVEFGGRPAHQAVVDLAAGAEQLLAVPLVLADDRAVYFEFRPPANETVSVTLEHASMEAWTELYARVGDVPTPGLFDFRFANPLDLQPVEAYVAR